MKFQIDFTCANFETNIVLLAAKGSSPNIQDLNQNHLVGCVKNTVFCNQILPSNAKLIEFESEKQLQDSIQSSKIDYMIGTEENLSKLISLNCQQCRLVKNFKFSSIQTSPATKKHSHSL